MPQTHWPSRACRAQGCTGRFARQLPDNCQIIVRPVTVAIVIGLGGAMSDIPVNREFWDRLVREVRLRTRGRADPEELLHSAYLRLMRYRAQHVVENIAGFLVRTAVNIGVDNYRHERFIADISPEDCGARENSPLQDEVLAARVRL